MKKKKNYLDLVLYPNKSLSLTSMLFLSSIFVILSFLISLYFINNGAFAVGVLQAVDEDGDWLASATEMLQNADFMSEFCITHKPRFDEPYRSPGFM